MNWDYKHRYQTIYNNIWSNYINHEGSRARSINDGRYGSSKICHTNSIFAIESHLSLVKVPPQLSVASSAPGSISAIHIHFSTKVRIKSSTKVNNFSSIVLFPYFCYIIP